MLVKNRGYAALLTIVLFAAGFVVSCHRGNERREAKTACVEQCIEEGKRIEELRRECVRSQKKFEREIITLADYNKTIREYNDAVEETPECCAALKKHRKWASLAARERRGEEAGNNDRVLFDACKSELMQLRIPLNDYYEENGTYASAGLAPRFFGRDDATDADLEAAVRRACSPDWTVRNIAAEKETYTITGVARDSRRCGITVGPDAVKPGSYNECGP